MLDGDEVSPSQCRPALLPCPVLLWLRHRTTGDADDAGSHRKDRFVHLMPAQIGAKMDQMLVPHLVHDRQAIASIHLLAKTMPAHRSKGLRDLKKRRSNRRAELASDGIVEDVLF